MIFASQGAPSVFNDGKVALVVNDTSGFNYIVGKFATGIKDTGGKDTGGK